MRLFKRKRAEPTAPKAQHTVIVHYSLSDNEHGTVAEREAIFELEDRLLSVIDARGLGEFDGNEFDEGEAVLYCYGPDADRLSLASRPNSGPSRPVRPTPNSDTATSPIEMPESSASTSSSESAGERRALSAADADVPQRPGLNPNFFCEEVNGGWVGR
ncbi:MAG TPA: hypothetical protein VFR23_25235 [Jiangellaceae bacterium]|nr:hypothetical protein [Jiangellaceae bacterium]